MSFAPIAYIIPQYESYPNWWLKAYEQGTTTPKPMAIDELGNSQAAKFELNIDGFPTTAGLALVIPFIDGSYDLFLFPTEAEADANDTNNALRLANDITTPALAGAGSTSINELTTASMTANTNKQYEAGDVVQTAEFSTGGGGGGTYDAVLTSSVTPNAFNIIIGVADSSISFVLRPESQLEAYESRTWYVDPILGVDVFGNGVSVGIGAFKTIQYAYDQLPNLIPSGAEQTIQLADGVYNENYRPASELARPSILFMEGKSLMGRTDKQAGRIVAPIRFVGNLLDNTACVIETAATYGKAVIYNTKGQIGFDSITLRGVSGTPVDELIISHRQQSYIHMVDCILDGISPADTNTGLLTESGGRIEFVGTGRVRNCREGAYAISNGDEISIASNCHVHDCTNGLTASNGGRIEFVLTGSSMRIYNCSLALNGQTGGLFLLRGLNAANRVSIESPISLLGASLECVFADLEETITLEQSNLFFNNAGHQEAVTALAGSNVRYRTADTYTTGNTENDSSDPIRSHTGSSVQLSGTNNLVKAGGSTFGIGDSLQSVSSNGSTISISPWHKNILIRGSGANFTGNVLSAPAEQNQEVTIYGDSFNVDLIASTTAYFGSSGGIAIGNSAGADYHSVTVKATAVNGTLIWRESGRSGLN